MNDVLAPSDLVVGRLLLFDEPSQSGHLERNRHVIGTRIGAHHQIAFANQSTEFGQRGLAGTVQAIER